MKPTTALSKKEREKFGELVSHINRDLTLKSPSSVNFPKGSYQYPFGFSIPTGLPSSFDFRFLSKKKFVYAKIHYKIIAGIIDYQTLQYLKAKEKITLTTFRLTNPLPNFKSFAFSLSKSKDVTQHKNIKFDVQIPDSTVRLGKDCEVAIAVDARDCTSSVHRVKIELVQSVEICAKDQTQRFSNLIWQKQLLKKLDKGAEFTGDKAIKVTVPGSSTCALSESAATQNIKNKYFFSVTFYRKTGLFGNDEEYVMLLEFVLRPDKVHAMSSMAPKRVSQVNTNVTT
jgi:hypothetical protein